MRDGSWGVDELIVEEHVPGGEHIALNAHSTATVSTNHTKKL